MTAVATAIPASRRGRGSRSIARSTAGSRRSSSTGTAPPCPTAPPTPQRLRELVEELCALGLELAVITGTHVENVDGQLRARPAGPGRLHFLVNRGSEVFARRRGRPSAARIGARRRRRRTRHSTAAAAATVEALAAAASRAEIVSERLNRRKIDLIPADWADPPKARIGELLRAVEERLSDAGLARPQRGGRPRASLPRRTRASPTPA